jgi:thiol-disulfide isomerase/thioredoxin
MKRALFIAALVVLAASFAALFYLQSDFSARNREEQAHAALEAILGIEEDDLELLRRLDAFVEEYGDLDESVTAGAHYYRFSTYAEMDSPDEARLLRYAEALDRASAEHWWRAHFLNMVAFDLADLNVHLDRAEAWAREALELAREKEDNEAEIADTKDTLGWVLYRAGRPEEAMPLFEEAVEAMSEDSSVLRRAGLCAESLERGEEAVEYYVRSLAVFGNEDESLYEEHLRPLYVSLYENEKGLTARLESAREAARRHAIFEIPRVEGAPRAPDWTLPGFEGEGALAAFTGKVLVLKIWGYWCMACREDFPHFQRLYEKFVEDGTSAAVLSIDWERGKSLEESREIVRRFFDKEGISVPTFFDVEGEVVEAYEVHGFPTTLVLDGEGVIRYHNEGFHPRTEEILEAQVEDLLSQA